MMATHRRIKKRNLKRSNKIP